MCVVRWTRLLSSIAVRDRTARRALIALAVLLCLARSTMAQEPSKLEPPDLENYRRWGPIWARPGIALDKVGYDTNILVSPEGFEVPDYTATLSPRLEGLVLFGRSAFLTFVEKLSYTAYMHYTSQNYLDNEFETRATLPADRVGVFVAAGLTNVQLRPADLEDIRTRQQERKFQAGLILEPGWRTEIELSGIVNHLSYTDPDDLGISTGRTVGAVLDRTETSLEWDSSWRAGGRSKLLLDVQVSRVEFDQPGYAFGIPIDRDGTAWRLLPGIRLGEGGPLEGVVHVGWGQYNPQESFLPRFSDWIGDMNLVYLLGWRTHVIFSGERIPAFSLIEGSPYYLDTDLGLRVVHYVTRLVGLEAGAARGTITFPGSFNTEDRIDHLHNWDGGIRLRMYHGDASGRLEYSLRVTHYDRTSNVPGVDRVGTTLEMGVVAGF